MTDSYEFLTSEWFQALNNLFLSRRPFESEPAFLSPIRTIIDVQTELKKGAQADHRMVAMNFVMTGETTSTLNVLFQHGHFEINPGLLSFCSAICLMDIDVARDGFRNGTDITFADAVATGVVEAAGSWDTINFIRTFLVPKSDGSLRRLTK